MFILYRDKPKYLPYQYKIWRYVLMSVIVQLFVFLVKCRTSIKAVYIKGKQKAVVLV